MQITKDDWDLVCSWLNGNSSVEDQLLWGGNYPGNPGGLFLAMAQRASTIARSYIRRLDLQWQPSRKDLDTLALGHAWTVLQDLKRTKTAADFPSPAVLGAYLEKALRGVIDLINSDLGLTPNPPVPLVSIDQPLPSGHGGEDDEGLTPKDLLADPGPSPEEIMVKDLKVRVMGAMLSGFAEFAENKQKRGSMLRQHLCLILEYFQRDLLAVVEFLGDKGTHYEDLTRWLEARGLRPDTTRQRNLRLRALWHEFLAGPGRRLWDVKLDGEIDAFQMAL